MVGCSIACLIIVRFGLVGMPPTPKHGLLSSQTQRNKTHKAYMLSSRLK